jgi:murein DD-endopeptidase MepM/ murein hydrolase activator NlpD
MNNLIDRQNSANYFLILAGLFIITIHLVSIDVHLNRYGRIEVMQDEIISAYTYEHGEYFIQTDDKKLIGNSLFKTSTGFLTIVCEHENIPSWLRVYDEDGNLMLYRQFDKIINLTLSPNKQYAIFFDGNYLHVLHLSDLLFETYEKSVQFAVSNQGKPLYVDENNKVNLNWQKYSFSENIQNVHFVKDIAIVIGEKSVFSIENEVSLISTFQKNIYDTKAVAEQLCIVLRKESFFELYHIDLSGDSKLLDTIFFNKTAIRTEEPIFAPLHYGEENYPFPVGNSYAEIQRYGGTPYLHPGVDFLGNDFQEVYAVQDGFVKAVLTTGGAPYWRIAIANENISTHSKGYLYAHLNQNSISVNVGDTVQKGDFLGTLYPWGYYDFTHIHFAKIFSSGVQWNGNWWSTENVLFDVMNILDTTPPVFENALPESRYAFRDSAGNYLPWYELYGEFDIIVKCYDLANANWKIDIHDCRFSLHSTQHPEVTVYEQNSFTYDFDLDTYLTGSIDSMILNTIYSTDTTCYSTGNYENREYYHIITNSDGETLDSEMAFDSTQFPDGSYWLKVIARDASLNTTADSMVVIFSNGFTNATSQLPDVSLKISNYPNPFNPETTIVYQLPAQAENPRLGIYNIKGQRVRELQITNSNLMNHKVVWDGKDENNNFAGSGIYLCRFLLNNHKPIFHKMILMK